MCEDSVVRCIALNDDVSPLECCDHLERLHIEYQTQTHKF